MNRTFALCTHCLVWAMVILVFMPLSGNAGNLMEGRKVAPEKVVYEVPTLQRSVVFSHPAYLASEIEETPYQLLQVCEAKGHCETLYDARGRGGFSIANNPGISFSPDRLYFILLQMTAVESTTKTYRSHYFEIYGVREAAGVAFRIKEGKEAETGNILRWSPDEPHALEISIGKNRKALAYPVSDSDASAQ